MRNLNLSIFFSLFIISTLLQCSAVYIYFTGFLNLKIKKLKFILIIIFIMTLDKFIPNSTNIVLKMLLFIVVLLICNVFCFYGSLIKKVYHIVFFELIIILEEEFFSISTYSYGTNFETHLIFPIIIYFLFNIIALTIVVLIVKFLLYFKADNELGLNTKEYLLLMIVPILSLLSIVKINEFNLNDKFLSCLFLLIVNICIMFIYDNLIRKNYILQQYAMIELQNEYYKSTLDRLNEITTLRHDLKNILLNLDSYLLNNKIDEARNQIKKLIEINNVSSELSYCVPIDAILDNKIKQIKEYNINYNLNIKIPKDINFDNNAIDLASILGNLLDNSIEALLRLPSNIEKKIDINIKYIENKLLIEIINTSNPVNIDDWILKSEKKVGRYGIGINSIKERAKKLNGYYDFSYSEGLFNALVILPI